MYMSDDNAQSIKIIRTFFFITLILAGVFLTGVFFAQASSNVSCEEDNLDGKTDKELELALEKCDKEIEQQKALLNSKQKDSVTIEFDIAKLDYKINQAKAEIRKRGML